ncbi:6PGL phosphogluconolactonase, partial [Dromaius novaehollandiae]|nr:6PGL phosphogluconolactonase [Dromaius novaehollandiae]
SSLAQLVAQRAAEAGGRFSLGLSGGSLVRILSQELPAAAGPAAPARWLLAFCDERLVPPEHPESTFGAYKVSGAGGGARRRARAAPDSPSLVS